MRQDWLRPKLPISIHALREEGDTLIFLVFFAVLVFLSTPSARRATSQICTWSSKCSISIHALREEGDRSAPRADALGRNFYPRPPRGGRPSAKTGAHAWN